jgi:protein-disulfide isomerase-like protein with CxxC motif
MAHVEAMLMNQATALQAIFGRLVERGMNNDHLPAFEGNMRMALRANSGTNWTRIPRQTGQPFQSKLDTDSTANWTVK